METEGLTQQAIEYTLNVPFQKEGIYTLQTGSTVQASSSRKEASSSDATVARYKTQDSLDLNLPVLESGLWNNQYAPSLHQKKEDVEKFD